MGVDTPKVEWFKDGTLVNDTDKIKVSTIPSYVCVTCIIRLLEIRNFQPHDAGIYKCVATNVVGMASGNITLLRKSFAYSDSHNII